jgi:hypothetical protein
VQAYEEALDLTPEADADRIAYRANLGNVLHQRYDVTHDRADLDRGIHELSAAVDATPRDSLDSPMYVNNLCAMLSARGDLEHDPADLEQAASLLEAVGRRDERSVHRPGLLVNLGNARSELARLRRHPEDRAAARRAYRTAVRTGLAANPADALAGACNWSEWAVERRAWAEVVEAHGGGMRAAWTLLNAQIARADKESWLRDAQGLSSNGAYACIRRSDPKGALVALEMGRVLLGTERLERNLADFARLERDRDGLACRYRNAVERMTRLERTADPTSSRHRGAFLT